MPAHRKPTAVLALSGAFKKNPQRRRKDPATTGPLGDPPAHLNDRERACWFELVALAPINVLTAADAWHVENAARIMSAFRDTRVPDQMLKFSAQLRLLCAQLGMTPADRSRVAGEPAKPAENPFEKLDRLAASAKRR